MTMSVSWGLQAVMRMPAVSTHREVSSVTASLDTLEMASLVEVRATCSGTFIYNVHRLILIDISELPFIFPCAHEQITILLKFRYEG